MRRRFLTALIVSAAFAMTACGAGTKAPAVDANPTQAYEEDAESSASSTETSEGVEEASDSTISEVATTTAQYVKDENTEADGKLMFKNNTFGEFVCNISGYTDTPDSLMEGEEYTIVHSNVMAMSLPGILPQVYSIRSANTDVTDTYAELVGEDEETLTFMDADGNKFMTDKFGDQTFVIGDSYLVSHTANMTKSAPGKYLDVRRILDISSLEGSDAEDEAAPSVSEKEAATLGVKQD